MSYFRRGYNWEQVHYLPAPVGGWNPDANSWELPQNQAPVLDNFLIQPGKIVARGGFQVYYDLTAHAPLNVCGLIPLQNTHTGFIIGQRAANTGIDPWNAPLVGSAAGDLAAASTTVLTAFGSVSTATWTLDQIPGPRWINYDGSYYGISYDASTAPTTSHDTNSTYTTKNTNLLIWNGSGTPTVGGGSPRGMVDLKGHLGRLWMLAGVDVPGAATVHNPNVIFFSNPMPSPGGLLATNWQDPASGLTNQIVMDQDNTDPGVALAATRNALVVLRKRSIWTVLGTTTANFAVKLVSKEAGCIDARSVVETDRGIYFMSEKGLMLTNGVTVALVSGSVMHTLQTALTFVGGRYYSFNNTPYVTCSLTSSGSILVSIGFVSSGSVNPVWSGLYDTDTNSWTRITSSLWSSDGTGNTNKYPGLLFNTQGGPTGLWAIGDKYITVLDDAIYNSRALSTPRGQVANGSVLLYDRIGTSYQPIPLEWRSRIVPIVGASTLARKFGQAKRYFLDYTFAPTASFQPQSGWDVVPRDVSNDSLGSQMDTPLGTLPQTSSVNGLTAAVAIARDNQDFVNEVSDFSFDITFSDSNRTSLTVPQDGVFELYGVGAEFQPTRDLR